MAGGGRERHGEADLRVEVTDESGEEARMKKHGRTSSGTRGSDC